MDTEKTQYGNGQDDSPPEEKKPIIDQVTDLGADAAGTLAETAVKAGAKKAREAIAKRLSRPVAFLSRLLEAGVDVRFDADAGGWSRSDLVEWG